MTFDLSLIAITTTAVTNNIHIPCRYCGFKYAPSVMTYHEVIVCTYI